MASVPLATPITWRDPQIGGQLLLKRSDLLAQHEHAGVQHGLDPLGMASLSGASGVAVSNSGMVT